MNCCRRLAGIVLAASIASLVTGSARAEPVRLTTSGSQKFAPSFLHGGQEVVFTEAVKPTQLQLNRLRLADGTVEPLHPDTPQHELDFAVSRDGTHQAYVKCHAPLSLSLQIVTADNAKLGEIPPAPGLAGYRSPTFTPDNTRLLYSFPEDTQQHIFSVSVRGDDKRQLTTGVGINNWPSVSPDGGRIVFASTRDGNYDLYSMAADGGDVRRLTDSPTMDMRPRFSPDGRQIAFTSNRDGNYEIYVIDADGGGLTRVTEHPERDDYAEWHPDGRQLVMVAERGGRHDLWLVDVPK
jgi:Tol biopolymer transport system component